MNYKLLFEMEVENIKQLNDTLDWYKNELWRVNHLLRVKNRKIEELESKKLGEVEPKLQQRIITEIYV